MPLTAISQSRTVLDCSALEQKLHYLLFCDRVLGSWIDTYNFSKVVVYLEISSISFLQSSLRFFKISQHSWNLSKVKDRFWKSLWHSHRKQSRNDQLFPELLKKLQNNIRSFEKCVKFVWAEELFWGENCVIPRPKINDPIFRRTECSLGDKLVSVINLFAFIKYIKVSGYRVYFIRLQNAEFKVFFKQKSVLLFCKTLWPWKRIITIYLKFSKKNSIYGISWKP